MIPRYQEDVAQLLVLEVGLHLAESLFGVIGGLEELVGGVGVHSGEGAQSQPVEGGREERCNAPKQRTLSVELQHICILSVF